MRFGVGECTASSVSNTSFSDASLLRYSRHIFLSSVDIEGQEKIMKGRVLIVGAGGLGCPVAMYLASAGVGFIRLMDGDNIDVTNLQRQVAYEELQVGLRKVEALKARMMSLNSTCVIESIDMHLTMENGQKSIFDVDIVVDCTDNFTARYLLNKLCFEYKKVLVSGAAIRFEGQVSTYDFRQSDSPCYECLYPKPTHSLIAKATSNITSDVASDVTEQAELSCSESGVFSPLVGVIGSFQAVEVLKILVGCGEVLRGRLLLIDVFNLQTRIVTFSCDPACPICA